MPTCKHMKRQYVHPSPYLVMSNQTCLGYKKYPGPSSEGNCSEILEILVHQMALIGFYCKSVYNIQARRVQSGGPAAVNL